MEIGLLELPNELIEIIIYYIIGRPWKMDVKDFLSFTSTCRDLQQFVRDEKYWRIMALRRDPTCDKPPSTINWFEYCKQIYSQRTIPSDQLKECFSRYNDNYFCTIEKVILYPNKIRIYIHERGDNSLGILQDPIHSIIAIVENNFPLYYRPIGIKANNSKYSIADEQFQYLGYLEFPYNISLDNIGKNLIFQYGIGGYTNAILFHIDRTFINKYNIIPLLKKSENNPKPYLLLRTKSI